MSTGVVKNGSSNGQELEAGVIYGVDWGDGPILAIIQALHQTFRFNGVLSCGLGFRTQSRGL